MTCDLATSRFPGASGTRREAGCWSRGTACSHGHRKGQVNRETDSQQAASVTGHVITAPAWGSGQPPAWGRKAGVKGAPGDQVTVTSIKGDSQTRHRHVRKSYLLNYQELHRPKVLCKAFLIIRGHLGRWHRHCYGIDANGTATASISASSRSDPLGGISR